MMQFCHPSIMQGRWKVKLVSFTSHSDESVSDELPFGAIEAMKKLEKRQSEAGRKRRRGIPALPASTEKRLLENGERPERNSAVISMLCEFGIV